MPQSLRLATFNCENLFSRPRIFGETAAKSKQLLGAVASLKEELSRGVFNKPKIKELETVLRGFATVNDVRGKHTSAAGAADWLGWVELTRDGVNDAAVANTARLIADIDADFICLVEVENRSLLQKFHDDAVYGTFLKAASRPPYEHMMLIDGNDDRGIDVAFLSRLPVLWMRSHVHERTTYLGRETELFSRDCLEARALGPKKKQLHFLLNHFKSMGYNPPQDPNGNIRRKAQAQRVAELVGERDLKKEGVVVAGDFNSEPTSNSLAPLLKMKGLYNVNERLGESDRGTYQTSKKQLDYLLVSDPLKAKLFDVRIERRGYFTSRWPHYDTVTSERANASDHCAVVADFQF